MRLSPQVHVDQDGLVDFTARRVHEAAGVADCAAALRDGGLGVWWRDGRPTGLPERLTAIADRLDGAVDGVGETMSTIRRRSAELAAADADGADGLRSAP